MFLVRTHIARLSWDQSFISQVLVFIKVLNILDMETVHSFVQPKAEDILRRKLYVIILQTYYRDKLRLRKSISRLPAREYFSLSLTVFYQIFILLFYHMLHKNIKSSLPVDWFILTDTSCLPINIFITFYDFEGFFFTTVYDKWGTLKHSCNKENQDVRNDKHTFSSCLTSLFFRFRSGLSLSNWWR